ncbi:MAG: hypothetical protein SFT92_03530 [Rickettsiales bacterium]|nr:hypothetical protein [Rickettsiales bacterium]
MREQFFNIAKSAAVLFCVGSLLALAAGPIAGLLGESVIGATGMGLAATMSKSVLWTGIYFGTLGALRAAVEPIMDKLFCSNHAATTPSARSAPELGSSVVKSCAPEREAEIESCAPCHVQKLMEERAQQPSCQAR